MENYLFSGTLFVPVENFSSEYSFVWAGTLTNAVKKVDVIVFPTETKEQIVPLMKADLEKLRMLEQTDNVKAQIAFIERALQQVPDGSVWRKEPDINLLEAAERLVDSCLIRQNKRLMRLFTKENIIYTQGIAGVYK